MNELEEYLKKIDFARLWKALANDIESNLAIFSDMLQGNTAFVEVVYADGKLSLSRMPRAYAETEPLTVSEPQMPEPAPQATQEPEIKPRRRRTADL